LHRLAASAIIHEAAMHLRRYIILSFALLCLMLAWSGVRWLSAGEPSFDKLSDKDRQAFAKRSEREVWPLMTREGKKGCVGCHSGKIVSALKLTGDASKDFHMLLKEGFFLYEDPGSLLARITDKTESRRMPKDGTPWVEKDVEVLRSFVADLDKKQAKK
jgi:hypothetical protein